MTRTAALFGLLLAAMPAQAVTITFTEFGVPDLTELSNEYQSLGITLSSFYQYTDSRDTFDSQGIANLTGKSTITFTTAADDVSFDFLVLPFVSFQITALDAGANILEIFAFDATANTTNASHSYGAGGIKYLVLEGPEGNVGLSTLRFDGTAGIPEPMTWTMMILGFGLVGLAARRRPVATA